MKVYEFICMVYVMYVLYDTTIYKDKLVNQLLYPPLCKF